MGGDPPPVHSDANLPSFEADLERHRSYLYVLATSQVALRGKGLDLSGVVQQTLIEAHQTAGSFRGERAQIAGWLRRMLANNLADAAREAAALKRGGGRRISLESDLDRSSSRLLTLAREQSSPSRRLDGQEQAMLLADAMSRLPEAQREALILQYWQGMKVDGVAARLGRTPAAVAGLLKRAMKTLREEMADGQGGAS
jgi:RNA polymerase sigma-70 factor (ECF subfamily)